MSKNKKFTVVLAIMAILMLVPAAAYAAPPTIGAATVTALGKSITVPVTGAVDMPFLSAGHGWSVKVGNTIKKIDYVTVLSNTATIYLLKDNYISSTDQGSAIAVKYTKASDKDKQIRNATPEVSDTASSALVTNGSTAIIPTLNVSSSQVNTNGVSILVYFAGDSIDINRLTGLVATHGWTADRTVSGTAYVPLTIKSVAISGAYTLTLNVDSAKPILPGQKVRVAYLPPTDIDKKIISSKGVHVAKIDKTVIPNNSAVHVPTVTWGTSSVGADGKTITLDVQYGQVVASLTTGHGWAVQSKASVSATAYAVETIQSVSAAAGTVTIVLKDDDKKILASDFVNVSYTKPSTAGKFVYSDHGVPMETFKYHVITNSSGLVKPALVYDGSVAGNGVQADGFTIKLATVTGTAYDLKQITQVAATGGWTVSVGTTTKVAKVVKKITVGTNLVTLEIANDDKKITAADGQTVNISYAKGTNAIESAKGIFMDNLLASVNQKVYNTSAAAAPATLDYSATTNAYVYNNVVHLKFSDITAVDKAGWVVKVNGIARTVSAATVGAGTNTVALTFGGTAVTSGTVTVKYTTTGTGTKSSTGILLKTFADTTVNADATNVY